MTVEQDDFDFALDEPDNPLVEGEEEYSVRLIYKVNANNPEHARTRFIQMLNQFGMNTWIYRVTHVATEEEFLVQEGAVMHPEEFAAQMAAEAAAEEDEGEEDEGEDKNDIEVDSEFETVDAEIVDTDGRT